MPGMCREQHYSKLRLALCLPCTLVLSLMRHNSISSSIIFLAVPTIIGTFRSFLPPVLRGQRTEALDAWRYILVVIRHQNDLQLDQSICT